MYEIVCVEWWIEIPSPRPSPFPKAVWKLNNASYKPPELPPLYSEGLRHLARGCLRFNVSAILLSYYEFLMTPLCSRKTVSRWQIVLLLQLWITLDTAWIGSNGWSHREKLWKREWIEFYLTIPLTPFIREHQSRQLKARLSSSQAECQRFREKLSALKGTNKGNANKIKDFVSETARL